ncbi:MAG TPA: alpha/beta hydrolase [Caulobacteraceae bacterium]|jgi:pimeloyl-ACP methyl ester carboxylesterase
MTFLHLLQRLFALLSLAILAVGGFLLWSWSDQRDEAFGWAKDDRWLYLGAFLLAWSFVGGFILPHLLAKPGHGPHMKRGHVREVTGADGSRLHVESFGPQDAPAVILTHGWGLDLTVWGYLVDDLAERFNVVTWDLPGLGRSGQPSDGHYDMDRLAGDLNAVLETVRGRPAVLAGHSIGGMITETFCRDHPEKLGREVKGLVLLNTTHLDPTKTTFAGSIVSRLKPVLDPMLKLDIALSPLVWLLNWQSYLSGSTHMAVRIGGFSKRVNRGEVDLVARLSTKHSPAVQAKGILAMERWDVTGSLPVVVVPTLVLAGRQDLVTKCEAGETIAGLIPRAQFVAFDEAGHGGFLERCKSYGHVIADFVEQVLPSPDALATRTAAE